MRTITLRVDAWHDSVIKGTCRREFRASSLADALVKALGNLDDQVLVAVDACVLLCDRVTVAFDFHHAEPRHVLTREYTRAACELNSIINIEPESE